MNCIMKNLQKTFKIRASACSQIMSSPQWWTPRQKYDKLKNQIDDKQKKFDETKNQETKTALKMKDDIEKRTKQLESMEETKDNVILSDTSKSYVDKWLKKALFGREQQLNTNAIQKWIECESEWIVLLNKLLWSDFMKSRWWKMENDHATWKEDIDAENFFSKDYKATVDIKCAVSMDTFSLISDKVDPAYYRQWQVYMWLKWPEYKRHAVAKVLVNTPERMLKWLLIRLYKNLEYKYDWNYQEIAKEYEEQANKLFLNNVFDQQISMNAETLTLKLTDEQVIPIEHRINMQWIERNDEDIEKIIKHVWNIRWYIQQAWF